ncbi:MAG: hypothetical protein JW720_08950 [Sedimentisphaerales bacterium]|nr:hypothetical protein [Sedimentisphaerales bacterium]
MKARPENIERLLNGYIDGELTVRQQTEVKRLLKNDSQVARRLVQLQKCKMLIGSLPAAKAPPEILEDVMAKLARRSLLGKQPAAANERAGIRELFFRKVLAAAAMIALMAVLGAVVYTIVAPPGGSGRSAVVNSGLGGSGKGTAIPKVMLAKFNGRLELETPEFREMDASINRAIEENGLLDCKSRDRFGERTTYVLTCGRNGLNRLLDRVEKNWARLDSAKLFVETDILGQAVAVDAVTPDQISEIAGQATAQDSVRLAKDFALLNSVTEELRGRAVLAADDKAADLMAPPRPRLTRPIDGEAIKEFDEDATQIELVIVVTRSK